MKRKENGRVWIPALMISSSLLLTTFLTQWIVNQYRTADAEMQKDIKSDLYKTSDQLLDSLMVGLLPDSLHASVEQLSLTSGSFDSTPIFGKQTVVRRIAGKNPAGENGIHIELQSEQSVIHLPDEKQEPVRRPEPGDTSNQLIIVQTELSQPRTGKQVNDLLAHGLGIFIKRFSSDYATHDILRFTDGNIDTSLFKQLLKHNWQSKGLEYRFLFDKNPSFKRKKPTAQRFYTGNPLFNNRIAVELTNRNNYLLLQILPQLLFGSVLLLITTIAFVFAYRNYRKQLQINTLRSHFVNNISHELKTPVSTVRVALEALQHYNRKDDPKVMDEYLGLMSLEVERLDSLIQQVMTSALLDSGQNFLLRVPTNIQELIRKTVRSFEWQAGQQHSAINLELPTETILFTLDPIHIQGVLGNLLDNSLKYAGNNSEISIQAALSLEQLTISVSDNGPGIPAEFLGQLFDQFFRVPDGDQHNVKGYGLGLSYCFQIMEQHNGSISVRNNPDRGCTFTLSFPVIK